MENNPNTKRIADFAIFIDKPLGKGAFGCVYFGYKLSDPAIKVAAKVMSNSNIQNSPNRDKIVESIKREIAVLKKIANPNVVQLLSEYITSNNIYLIFEYCKDGDLQVYRESRGGAKAALPEGEALTFFRHICNGFKALNQAKIIHRDIKPSNILLHEGMAKIADFGFARFTEDTDQKSFMTEVGSPLYMAPEIFCQNKYSSKCDVWSLGVLLFELLYGVTPWTAKSAYELFHSKILKTPLKFPENPKRSAKIKDLIKSMLTLNQDHRISWDELFKHELVNESPYVWKDLQKSGKLDGSLTESLIKSQSHLRKQLVQGALSAIPEKMDLESPAQDPAPPPKQPSPAGSESKQLFKRVRDLMLYERNVAFFLKGACHLLVGCFGAGLVPVDELFLYETVFLLQKFEMALMKYSLEMAEGKVPLEKLPTEEFFRFSEYPLFLRQIRSDFEECEAVYLQVLELVRGRAALIRKEERGAEFLAVMQGGLICDQNFCKVYQETMQEFMDRVSLEFFVKAEKPEGVDMEYLKLLRFLQIASTVDKPFGFFRKTEGEETSQLFFQFYDDIAEMDAKELVEVIKKNWSK